MATFSNPAIPLLLSIAALSGCFGGNGGNLQFSVTDQPSAIGDFSSLLVTPDKVEVHLADKEEWLGFAADKTFDLTKLTGGRTEELVNASLAAGRYTQIRLMVTKAEGTLKSDGSKVNVNVPSNQLLVVKTFEVAEGKTTTFTMDINVVRSGPTYQLTPVVGTSTATSPR